MLITLVLLARLCSKNEYTKSESNSQRNLLTSEIHANCVQRTNIQNLKAIHNRINHYVNFSFQLLGFFNSINKRKISIDKSCNY